MPRNYKAKNPLTKYSGKHIERFLKTRSGHWRIPVSEFSRNTTVSCAHIYNWMNTGRKIRKNFLDKILGGYPNFK